MVQIGYKLSSEEHGPRDLVRDARLAEDAGFTFALISDHFHPWTDRQGQSPFVWGVLGGLAVATRRLTIGTGVTCPTIRMHPAIVAHAAATAAVLLEGRFFLGVGSGENLNEHVLGDRWPPVDVRQAMLEEAIGVIRTLWQGGVRDHHGRYYTVENARLYTLPDTPPPIVMAAGGQKAGRLAGRLADGLVATRPDADLVRAFQEAGGEGKPCYGELGVCWAEDAGHARRTVHEWWPITALAGPLHQELALPAHFEAAARIATEAQATEHIPCGPDPAVHVAAIEEFVRAGFDHVCVHQIGPDQAGFVRFYQREVLPRVTGRRAAA